MAGGGGLACLDVHVLSLLPRTLGSRFDSIAAPGGDSEDKEFDSIRCLFKSMISPDCVEPSEARRRVTVPLTTTDEDRNEIETINPVDQMQERREALGRKRARFSFKPEKSDPLLRVGATLNVDHIKDPDEFFSAIEKMEYADKVLKKIRGHVVNEPTENPQGNLSRKRRPSILGRRAGFKHHFRVQAELSESTSTSQFEDHALSPLKCTKDTKSSPISLPTSRLRELEQEKGSNTTEEGNVDQVLNKLLFCFEDIDEGEEIKFLERKLQVDSINVDRICLPPLDRCHGNNIAITDGKKTGEILGSTENISKNVRRSPLASIAIFKRRILQKDLFMDSFDMGSLSDSSSENSSLSKGSLRSSKSKSRSHNKRKSQSSAIEIQSRMRMSPNGSFADSEGFHHQESRSDVANDGSSGVIQANFRDKVDDLLQEASVSKRADLPRPELQFGASFGLDASVSSGVDLPEQVDNLMEDVSASKKVDIPEEVDNLVKEASASKGVDIPEKELQLGGSSGHVDKLLTTFQEASESNGVDLPEQVDNLLQEASMSKATDLPEQALQLGASSEQDASISNGVDLLKQVDNFPKEASASKGVDIPDQEFELGTSSVLVASRSPSNSTIDSTRRTLSFETGVEADKEVEASVANEGYDFGNRLQSEGPGISNRMSDVVVTFDVTTSEVTADPGAARNTKMDDFHEAHESQYLENTSVTDNQKQMTRSSLSGNQQQRSRSSSKRNFDAFGSYTEEDSSNSKASILGANAPLDANFGEKELNALVEAIVADKPDEELHPRSPELDNRIIGGPPEDRFGKKVDNALTEPLAADEVGHELQSNPQISDSSQISGRSFKNKVSLGSNSNSQLAGVCDKVSDTPRNSIPIDKGFNVVPCAEATARSSNRLTTRDEQLQQMFHPSIVSCSGRNGLNCQDEVEVETTNVLVPTALKFNSEDESDDEAAEAFFPSEGDCDHDETPEKTSLDNGITAESLEAAGDPKNKVYNGPVADEPTTEDQSCADAFSSEPVAGVHLNSTVIHGHSYEVCDGPEVNERANEDQSSADAASSIPIEGIHGHNNELASQPRSSPSFEQELPLEQQSKQKKANRRQSLAGAGTAWQCGLRRSTRIRTRPLAHWRGERLLFARIHDTLPTVIGVKYASPAKTSREGAALKVKSYVSDEYAELLQNVALH
ncbi:centromere protein C isoform X2 [Wolffia australiana]